MTQTKNWSTSSGTVTRDGTEGDGGSTRLYVGRISGKDYRSYVKFSLDWTGVGRIVSAILNVYSDDNAGLAHQATTTAPQFRVRQLTTAFTQGNNGDNIFNASDYTAPHVSTSRQVTAVPLPSPNALYTVDITGIVNRWAPNYVKDTAGAPGIGMANHGIGLIPIDTVASHAWAGWSDNASSSLRPVIVLTYDLGPTVPDTPTLLLPSGPVSSLNDFTGTFSDARATDTLAFTDIEVYTASATAGGTGNQTISGGVRVWSRSKWPASATDIANATFDVPATDISLDLNLNYKWRARVQDQENQTSLWTNLTTFQVTHSAPSAPTLTPDGQSYATVQGVVFTIDPGATDATAYQIELAAGTPSDNSPALLIWNTGRVPWASPGLAPQTYYSGPALAAGTYHWRARYWDDEAAASSYAAAVAITLTQDFDPAPGSQTRAQLDPRAPWRIVIRDMVDQTSPTLALVQTSTGGATDFGTDLNLGTTWVEDTTTDGYAVTGPRITGLSNLGDGIVSHLEVGAHVLDTEPDLSWRAYVDLGSSKSLGAAEENTYGTCAVALEWGASPTGPWTEVASAAAWAAAPETGIPGTHRISFAPVSARYWAIRYDEGAATGLHYNPGTDIERIGLYGSAGVTLALAPTPGNEQLLWQVGNTLPGLPAGFANIAIVTVATTAPQRYGRMAHRMTQVGDTGSVVTSGADDAILTEWTGAYAGARATSKHASTAAMRAGGNVTPTPKVPVMIVGAAAMGHASSPSLSVTPLAGTTEIHDANVDPASWMGYKLVASPTTQYNVGGTINHAAQYGGVTVMLHPHAPNRGPNNVVAILEDAKSVGASLMHNAPGELHFTIPKDHPQIDVIEPKRTHYAVELYQQDGWREVFAGLVWDTDATETDVVFIGMDYLGLLDQHVDENFKISQPHGLFNQGGSWYPVSYKTGTTTHQVTTRDIVIDQLDKAIAQPNSLVNFIQRGTVATMTEQQAISAAYENTLTFITGLLDSHAQGTAKRTNIKVVGTYATGYSFVVTDDPGIQRSNLRMQYGELVQGYRIILFGKLWASVQDAIGRQRDGTNVFYSTKAAPGIDPALFGRIAQVKFFDGISDPKDLDRRLSEAAIAAGKIGKQVGLAIRTAFLSPRVGFDVPDYLPVAIVDGPIDTTRYGDFWDILGIAWEAGDLGQQDLILSLVPHNDTFAINPDLLVGQEQSPQPEWQLGYGVPDPDTNSAVFVMDVASGIIYFRNETGDASDDTDPAVTTFDSEADQTDP